MRTSLPSSTNCFIPDPSSSRHSLGTYTLLLPWKNISWLHFSPLSPLLPSLMPSSVADNVLSLLQTPDLNVLHRTSSPNNLHLYPNLEIPQTFQRKPGVTQVKKAGSLLQNNTFRSYPPNPIPQSHAQLWSTLLATMSSCSPLSFLKNHVDLLQTSSILILLSQTPCLAGIVWEPSSWAG